MIKVCFFAELRERLGCGEVEISEFSGNSVALLKQHIICHYPHWEKILTEKKLLVAVNHAMANNNTAVTTGDEVAFFPPVTGG